MCNLLFTIASTPCDSELLHYFLLCHIWFLSRVWLMAREFYSLRKKLRFHGMKINIYRTNSSFFAGHSNRILWSGQNVASKSSILDLLGLVDHTAVLRIRHLDGIQRTSRNLPQTNWIDAQSTMLRCQRGMSMRWAHGQSDQQLSATIATRQPRTSRIRWSLANAIFSTTTINTKIKSTQTIYQLEDMVQTAPKCIYIVVCILFFVVEYCRYTNSLWIWFGSIDPIGKR